MQFIVLYLNVIFITQIMSGVIDQFDKFKRRKLLFKKIIITFTNSRKIIAV